MHSLHFITHHGKSKARFLKSRSHSEWLDESLQRGLYAHMCSTHMYELQVRDIVLTQKSYISQQNISNSLQPGSREFNVDRTQLPELPSNPQVGR